MRMVLNSLFLTVFMHVGSVYALEITQVSHSPKFFLPKKGEMSDIYFTVSKSSAVKVNIYDDRDVLVRNIKVNVTKPGQQTVQWDGKDQAGNWVPPEAYRYTIMAEKNGVQIEHDFSDHTGLEQYRVKDIKWHAKKKYFTYTLNKPSRVFIRVGLAENGPLLATVLNWLPRTTGQQKQLWNGMDTSGVLDLTNHTKMLVYARAYTLSDNTILVGPHSDQSAYVKDLSWTFEKRKVKQVKKKRIHSPERQTPETRGDYQVRLVLPDGLKKTDKGVPIVSGMVSLLLEADKEYRLLAVGRRSEPVFYIDGQFSFENEVGFLPMTWRLDTSVINEGEHYLTANLRGYEGNFGLATVKVYVKHK